jgi:hypothetical protein
MRQKNMRDMLLDKRIFYIMDIAIGVFLQWNNVQVTVEI